MEGQGTCYTNATPETLAPVYMRVFAPGRLSSWDEFISVSGLFLVVVYTISSSPSRDDFTHGPKHVHRGRCHSGMKREEKCHVNVLPRMKVPCVNSVCEGMAR